MAAYAPLLPGIEIVVADIDENALAEARTRYGFKTIKLSQQGALPFDDEEWDMIFCNSVIEHVTIPKDGVWNMVEDDAFCSFAREQQAAFAAEIMRTTRNYFVQTPCRMFPIESHAWLPFVQYLPRRLLIPLLGNTNRWWLKRTQPDWCLMSKEEISSMFTDAEVIIERVFGLPRSLIAFRVV
jgi:2-polyprenyl-3-methyl-5-hydroxy-6-metoxy-1,4-benzoquinol methylase